MTERKALATWVDLQLAGVRWLAYLASAAGFALILLADPRRLTVTLSSLPVAGVVAALLLYNLLVTLFAWVGWLPKLLPAGTLLMDILLAAVAYLALKPVSQPVHLVSDPLIFLVLLPVVTASVRFGWPAGVAVALSAGGARAGIMLAATPDPAAPATLLAFLFGLVALLGLGFLSGFMADRVLRQGTEKEESAAAGEAARLRKALRREEALQEITSTLSDTLNFERALEQSLDVADKAMIEWGARGGLFSLIFLFSGETKLRLAAARQLPRYELKQSITADSGIIAKCLEQADIVVSQSPRTDPQLTSFTGLSNCHVAAAVPLRAGFETYGVMVFATGAFRQFDHDQLDLFSGIAERATIAVHNAMLYQSLQSEKDRIVQIEEDARRKLSRDLHDGPTQSVSAIAMRLNFVRKMLANQPEQMWEELETIEKLAQQTVKDIRHMLFTLRPLVLETEGLVPAIRALVEKVRETTDINIQVREVGTASSQLDESQAGVLFFIIEEALGNARKYSQASLVDVKLWIEDGYFIAQVADNGVGFDSNLVLGNYETRGSLGMVNMRERAELINGTLKVKSAPGRGTAITVVVPLTKQATRAA